MKRRYAIVIEKGERNYSAYLPDVPGCVATGQTEQEVTDRLERALAVHFRGTREDGDPIPKPSTAVGYVEVEVPTPVAA